MIKRLVLFLIIQLFMIFVIPEIVQLTESNIEASPGLEATLNR